MEKIPLEEMLCKNLLLNPNDKLYREAGRYLGYESDTKIPAQINAMIQKAMVEICATAEPRTICRYFSVRNDVNFQYEGIILMGATLGVSVDRLLSRAQVQNMAYALILDSCATAAIEEVCDNLQNNLINIYADRNMYLTNRHSPGYGNLPLSTQPNFILLLDAERKIGLGTTRNFLLTPLKSVTAMILVSRSQQKKERIPCNACV
ncbi:MAG: hypothetical protein LBD81_01955, partial [Holosporaceae bacterium]|nr:hypothetical protein [Holosporaceae bacterium]